MVKFIALCLLLILAHEALGLRLTDKLAKDAGDILGEAKTDKTIRQCSCEEQHHCFEESKIQLYDCLNECWGITKQLTNNTSGLKQCLTDKMPIIDNFFGCLETNLNSCSESKNADNITYIDYKKVINGAEKRIKKQTNKLTKSVGTSASKLIGTVLELGTCVKECFLKRNSDGFCFDRTGCQSKIEVSDTVKSLKKCSTIIKWKETAGEACQCAVGAGVNSLAQYCNILKTIERSRNSRTSS